MRNSERKGLQKNRKRCGDVRPEHGLRSTKRGLGSGKCRLRVGKGFSAAVVRGWNPAAFTRHSLAASPLLYVKVLCGNQAAERR